MQQEQRTHSGITLSVALLFILIPRPSAAQPCVGDCSGRGVVRIADLVLAVNIALGRAGIERCAALGGPPIGVPQLIASVNNSLCDCRPCRTRVPTRTETATPPPSPTRTETVTPSPSPTPTDAVIEQRWHEDTGRLVGSSCPNDIVNRIRGTLPFIVDDFIVRRRHGTVEVEGSSGTIYPASETDGTLYFQQMGRESQGACVVIGYIDIAVDLRQSPTTANYTFNFDTMSCPRMIHCRVRATTRWTLTSAAKAMLRRERSSTAARALAETSAYVTSSR